MGRDDRPTKGGRDSRNQGSTGQTPNLPGGGVPGDRRSFGQGSDGGGSESDFGVERNRTGGAGGREPPRGGEQRRDR